MRGKGLRFQTDSDQESALSRATSQRHGAPENVPYNVRFYAAGTFRADCLQIAIWKNGNAAAHGATIDPGVAFSAATLSHEVLETLDAIIEELSKRR